MPRLLELLGFPSAAEAAPQHTAAVRHIMQELEAFEPQRADFLAAFAYLLGRAANADLDVSDDEVRKMEEIVEQIGDLPQAQARLVVKIVRAEHERRGSTQNYQVAREFRRLSTREERRELLHCLFAVSAADETISGAEEKQLRQVAEELGFSHREYVEVRAAYNDKRSVIQRLHRGGEA